jgi:hypothetical protein
MKGVGCLHAVSDGMLIAVHALVAQRTVIATLLMTVLFMAFTAAQTQYRIAYKEHMTDPPLRPVSTKCI